MTYILTLKDILHSKHIDWSQSRVVFISPIFTYNQIYVSDFKDFGIELWEVKQFENNTISINTIRRSSGAPNIKPPLEKNEKIKQVEENIKLYTDEEHYINVSDASIELY